ncbi:MAG: metallophosphoesterase [Candidatus Woesearchaeota archaeon]|nr:metallophosphoesterase [Candidatus Woesearchaeota archaeon]
MADCHIGSWRDQKLRDLSIKAFTKAIDECIKQNVDFVLISGDLFNTALPAIDSLKLAVKKLKELKDKDINVYGIAGSHDYSSSGKTMIDVLVNAGLFTDVFKGSVEHDTITLDFTVDNKTGAKITGIKGRKGMLDRKYYEALNRKNLEEEKGMKIFLFHTAISEIKPKELEKIESAPMSYLPKGFDYYAGGHVHYIYEEKRDGYGLIAYPGALFPANFFEMEKYGNGGFYVAESVEAEQGSKKIELKWIPVPVKQTFNISVNCDNKNPKQVEDEIFDRIKGKEFINTIVLIRVSGTLFTGKPSDINFKGIFEALNRKSAYFVMKSTSMVTSREFADMKSRLDAEVIAEEMIIDKNLGFSKLPGITKENEKNMIVSLIKILSAEKEDGEKVHDFEKRVSEETEKIIKMN